jgi:hypothetical protein
LQTGKARKASISRKGGKEEASKQGIRARKSRKEES